MNYTSFRGISFDEVQNMESLKMGILDEEEFH
jgi:hypothetical protein